MPTGRKRKVNGKVVYVPKSNNTLSPNEQLNYDVISQMLKGREFNYNSSLTSMEKVMNELNENFDYSDFGEGKLYGTGGKKALDEFVNKLSTDYNGELKKIQKAIKTYESSKPTSKTKKYNLEKARLESAKRKESFFKSFR